MQREAIYFGNSRKPVKKAILHCAAVPGNWHQGKTISQIVETIRSWHLAHQFKDIGYHYIIDPNGVVGLGRSLKEMGAHTLGQNRDTLGILLIESAEINRIGKFEDYFTERQRLAVAEILLHHGISEIHGHNEYAPKLCPGFDVRALPSGYFTRSEQLTTWQKIGAILGLSKTP